MGKPSSFVITREFLYQSYYVEGLTTIQIARIAGCRNAKIVDALNEYGFFKKACKVTKEWLYEHFVTLKETSNEIAEFLGCNESSVRYHLRKYDIPIKKRWGQEHIIERKRTNNPHAKRQYNKRSYAKHQELRNYDWMYEQYITKQFSICRIAVTIGCSESTVSASLKRLHIPVRSLPHMSKGRKIDKGYERPKFSNRKRGIIFKRDNFHCQMPECPNTNNLEVHHIIPIKERGTNSFENGITLCRTCHVLTLGKEGQYASLFQSIISTKSGAAHLVSTPPTLAG